MRDDTNRWTRSRGLDLRRAKVGDFELQSVRPDRQTLVSGPVDAACAYFGLASASGWPDVVAGGPCAVRLRRDRILVVNGPEHADGWHDGPGLAVSDMTGGFGVIDLSGSRVGDVLQRGCEIRVQDPSPSVQRLFAGYETAIYRHTSENICRFHVARGFLDGLWGLLETFCADASGG